jgi:hypothetical protein
LLVIGAVAFAVGLALLIHLPRARHVATAVAVVSAVANFMFMPFYPFWSIVVLALNVLIIWELTRERGGGRGFARHLGSLFRLFGYADLCPAVSAPGSIRHVFATEGKGNCVSTGGIDGGTQPGEAR